MKVKKNNFKIILGIIIVLAIVIAIIFITKNVSTNNQILETEKALSQIDSTKLQDTLILELKQSKLNVIKQPDNMMIYTEFVKSETDNMKDYIVAKVYWFKGLDSVGELEIPCFKINTGSNGKFKSIEYAERTLDEYIVPPIIEKVFKEQYEIDLKITGNSKYNTRFNKDITSYTNKGTINVTNNDLLLGILSIIKNRQFNSGDNIPNQLKEYSTQTFGI